MQGILTKCECCAKQVGRRGKLCGRCKTPYCGPACQKKHWEEGGHDKLCKKIRKSGGAEPYNADTKYKEAVEAAAKKCAEDTKGQTCYICMEAVHRRTGEGLVRGCACGDRDGVASGTTGIAHVSCLAEQAKILVDEAYDNRDLERLSAMWNRWASCSLCEREYHGIVKCALGWACWKTYLGRPETDNLRHSAMTILGVGLNAVNRHEEQLEILEAQVAAEELMDQEEEDILVTQSNLALCYEGLGRREEAIRLHHQVYADSVRLGLASSTTLEYALSLCATVVYAGRYTEAKSLLCKLLPEARRDLGVEDDTYIRLRATYGQALLECDEASRDDVVEAMAIFEELSTTIRRIYGTAHPFMPRIQADIEEARKKLAFFDAELPDVLRGMAI